jgi:hypothetical protein
MNGISSDCNTTMAATLKFDAILSTVQSSNLNFHVEISPFSAVIHLKKSLIVNKLGIPQIPPPSNSLLLEQQKSYNFVLAQRIVFLENAANSLKSDYENALLDCQEAHKTISKLKEDLENACAVKENKDEAASKIKIYAMEEELRFKTKQIKTLDNKNGNLMVEIKASQKCVGNYRDYIDNEC